MTGASTIPCPRCDHGTWTDSNGARWRCAYCGGTGKLAYSDADHYDRIADEAAENFERPSERFRALMDERRSHDDDERRAA